MSRGQVDQALVDRPIIEQNVELLNALFAGCRERSSVTLVAGRGQAAGRQLFRAGQRSDLLPPALLKEFAFITVDDLQLIAATSLQGTDHLMDAPAVWVEFAHKAVFHQREWVVPEATVDVTRHALERFALPPSFVVDLGEGWFVSWLLATPARIDRAEIYTRVEALQRRLAEQLGGRTGSERVVIPSGSFSTAAARYRDIPAWDLRRPALRLPGSMNHDHGDGCTVRLVDAAFDRRYTLDALEQACASHRSHQ
jgi:hypothetical protein